MSHIPIPLFFRGASEIRVDRLMKYTLAAKNPVDTQSRPIDLGSPETVAGAKEAYRGPFDVNFV